MTSVSTPLTSSEIDDVPRFEEFRVRVGVHTQSGRKLQGKHRRPGVESSVGGRLKCTVQSNVQTTDHLDGAFQQGRK